MSVHAYIEQRVKGVSARSRAVGMFFATSVAARGVGVVCQLVQVPVALAALGAEGFGLWMTLTSVGAMVMFADFGMGQGAQNQLAEAFARGDRHEARALWDNAFVFLAAAGAFLAAATLLLVRFTDPSALFGLTDPALRAEAATAVTITLLLFCANVPLGLAQRLAHSRQRGWMHNIAQAAGSVGALAGTVLAIYAGWSFAGIVAAAQVPQLLGNAVLLGLQLRDLGWWDLHFRCQWKTIRGLLRLGAHFGVQQVQLTLFVTLPPLVISTALGAAAVTPYNLAQRLFNLFGIVQNAFMQPLWPAYSDAKARGELGWIRRTLHRSLGATVLCTLLPMTLGAVFAQPILAAWVGHSSQAAELPAAGLIWLLFAWNALIFLGQPFGFMLAGLSEVKRLTQCAVVSSIASPVLMFGLVHRFGQEGVVLGMIFGILPFILIGNIAEALRVLRRLRPGEGAAGPDAGEGVALSLRAGQALDSP